MIVVVGLMTVVGFVAGTKKDDILNLAMHTLGSKNHIDRINVNKIQEVYSVLKHKYDGNLDGEKLVEGATKGMVEAVGDKYTVFMDQKEAEAYKNNLNGDAGAGIGVEIAKRNNVPTIVRVLKDNSAIKAGVKSGDIIYEVNGENVSDKSVEEVSSKVRGEAGTTVKLKLKRGDEMKEFSIERRKIEIPSVELEFSGDTAIMRISRFDNNSGNLAKKYAEEINQKNAKKIIVDLRGNGGGYVEAAKDIASLWIDKNKVIVSEKRGDEVVDEVRADGNNILKGKNTVILTDGHSASASEIVAGALKEYGLAKIYGEKTYGKGSVQEMVPTFDDTMLKVTVAKWYTPNGININKEGIHPDKEVRMTEQDIEKNQDPQLDYAKAN